MTNFLSGKTLFSKNFTKLLLLSFFTFYISGTVFSGTLPDGLYAQMKTSKGDIVLRLFYQRTPVTVSNFVGLAEGTKEWKDSVTGKRKKTKFYDGLIFHRVIAGFVIQTGGYDVEMHRRESSQEIPNESFNGLKNLTGALSMARLADPDSASSQFFINLNANTHLDALPGKPGYTVFGHVVTGTDVAEAIEFAETGIRQGMAGVPLKPIVIHSVRRRPEEIQQK